MVGTFEIDDDTQARGVSRAPRTGGKTGAACVYFGAERLRELRRLAKKSKTKLSPFVCSLVDGSISVPPDRLAKLESLAKLRGLTPAELLGKLVDDAINRI